MSAPLPRQALPPQVWNQGGQCRATLMWLVNNDGVFVLRGPAWEPVPVPAFRQRPASAPFFEATLAATGNQLLVLDAIGNLATIGCDP